MEKIHKFVTEDLRLRAAAVVSTELVQKMRAHQNLFPLATMALGRTITGALLMASQLKEGQKVSLTFHGNGPLGNLFAEASYEGEARAYVHNPQADLPLKDGHLDVASGVGRGVLTVVRSQPFQKQPHVGIVPIVTGEVGDDLANYQYQSHQIPSIVALSVYLGKDGEVLAAGGVLIELMPSADESVISTLERKVQAAGSLSHHIHEGKTPAEFAKLYVHDSRLVPVDHPHPIKYTCRCSPQRVERTLRLLGKHALTEMVAKGTDTSVQCQFCGRKYNVTLEELKTLLESTLLSSMPVGTPPH